MCLIFHCFGGVQSADLRLLVLFHSWAPGCAPLDPLACSYHQGALSMRVSRKGQVVSSLEADWLELTAAYYHKGWSLVDSFVYWDTPKGNFFCALFQPHILSINKTRTNEGKVLNYRTVKERNCQTLSSSVPKRLKQLTKTLYIWLIQIFFSSLFSPLLNSSCHSFISVCFCFVSFPHLVSLLPQWLYLVSTSQPHDLTSSFAPD